VDPGTGLNDMEKRKFLPLPRLKLRSLGRPARSQWLYRLCYPGSKEKDILLLIHLGALPLTEKQYGMTLKGKKYIVTCQPIVGLGSSALLGSRQLSAS
jgi:hypothetical protein